MAALSTNSTDVAGTTNMFDSKAAEFDTNPLLQQICAVAGKELNSGTLDPDMTVMDFGCGTGLLSLAIADSVKAVVGVDSSQGMVTAFQSKIDSRPSSNMRAVCAELVDTHSLSAANDPANPFPEQFDLITSTMTFHHIPDIPALLRLLCHHLAPRGQVAVFDYRKGEGSHRFHPPEMDHTVFHKSGFDPGELTEYLAGAGLVGVTCRTLKAFQKSAGDNPLETMEFELLMAVGRKP